MNMNMNQPKVLMVMQSNSQMSCCKQKQQASLAVTLIQTTSSVQEARLDLSSEKALKHESFGWLERVLYSTFQMAILPSRQAEPLSTYRSSAEQRAWTLSVWASSSFSTTARATSTTKIFPTTRLWASPWLWQPTQIWTEWWRERMFDYRYAPLVRVHLCK